VHRHLSYSIELYANTFYSDLDKLIRLEGKNRWSKVVDLYVKYNSLPVPVLHKLTIIIAIFGP